MDKGEKKGAPARYGDSQSTAVHSVDCGLYWYWYLASLPELLLSV